MKILGIKNLLGCLLTPCRLGHYCRSYLNSLFFIKILVILEFVIKIGKGDEIQRYM